MAKKKTRKKSSQMTLQKFLASLYNRFRPVRRRLIHIGCGRAITMTGGDLVRSTNPFSLGLGFTCPQCGNRGTTSDFYWEDTDETIAARTNRLRRKVPQFMKYWRWGGGIAITLLLATLTGALYGFLVARREEAIVVGACTGAIFGGPILYFVSLPVIDSWYDIDFRTEP